MLSACEEEMCGWVFLFVENKSVPTVVISIDVCNITLHETRARYESLIMDTWEFDK